MRQNDAGENESEPCSSPAAAEMERIIVVFPNHCHAQDERRGEVDSDRDSIDDMCAEVRIEKKKDTETPKERKLPGYMMPTASSNRRTSMIREDNRKKSLCAMRPSYTPTVIDPEHLIVSSFMRPTASYTSRYSTVPSSTPVRSQQIRPVDPANLPRYMRDTVAYRRSLVPELEKTPVSPNRIREVDRAHLPHYMGETVSSRRFVEKVESKPVVASNRIKQVNKNNLPRFMQPTRAYEKFIEPIPEEEEPQPVSSKMIKEVNTKQLPHYMLPTQATRKHVAAERPEKASGQVMGSPSARPSYQSDRSGNGSQLNYMKKTLSFEMMEKKRQEEQKRREAMEAQQKRNKESMERRRQRWQENVERAERMTAQRREDIRNQVKDELRSRSGNV